MQDPPVCSVCIANYNGLALIDACLQSVFAQQCRFPYEVIVHDDASTDGSADYIAARYPNVKLLRSDLNVGYCVSNNRMANAAAGTYLLLLNNDAALRPDALNVLLGAAEAVVRPAILTLPQYDAETERLLDIGSLLDPFLNPMPNLDTQRRDVGLAMGACFWIPRALWHELGGFPEWFGSIGEDLFLCCRARLAGYPVQAIPRSGFLHHVGKSFGGGKILDDRLVTSRRRRSLSERNKSFVMAICYPGIALTLLPLHVVALLLEGLVLSLMKRDVSLLRDIYWAAVRALWHERRKLRQLRAEAQARRTVSVAAYFQVVRWFPHKLRLVARHGLPEIR